MAFNIKTRQAHSLWAELEAKPEIDRDGFSGFWKASLERVRGERIVRVADIDSRRFVFEAEIDPAETHTMTMARFNEYRAHEEVKAVDAAYAASLGPLDRAIRDCIAQGRIVVAFRNARAADGELDHVGSNPIWYTDD